MTAPCLLLAGAWLLRAPGTDVDPPVRHGVRLAARAPNDGMAAQAADSGSPTPADNTPILPDSSSAASEAASASPVDNARAARFPEERPPAAERQLAIALETLRQDEEHPQALSDAAGALMSLERWDEAAVLLGRRARQSEEVEVQARLATALLRSRRWVEAADVLQRVVDQRPEDGAAWFNLAVACQAARRLGAAERAWDRALQLDPDNLAARGYRGEVLLDLHEWAAAAADFEQVLTAEPDQIDARLNAALACFQAGDRSRAAAILQAGLARNPRSVPLWNRLAELHWTRMTKAGSQHEWVTARLEALQSCARSLDLDAEQPLIRGLEARIREARPPETASD